MNRLRRHSAWTVFVVLLIGGLPLLHTARHAEEYAHMMVSASQAVPDGASDDAPHAAASEEGTSVLAAPTAASERPACDLCAHTLHGTPTVTQPAAFLHEALSEKTRLRSRVVAATPYHFVIRGPPAHV